MGKRYRPFGILTTISTEVRVLGVVEFRLCMTGCESLGIVSSTLFIGVK